MVITCMWIRVPVNHDTKGMEILISRAKQNSEARAGNISSQPHANNEHYARCLDETKMSYKFSIEVSGQGNPWKQMQLPRRTCTFSGGLRRDLNERAQVISRPLLKIQSSLPTKVKCRTVIPSHCVLYPGTGPHFCHAPCNSRGSANFFSFKDTTFPVKTVVC